MYISRFALKNWRNYKNIDIPLTERVFIVGPNASGKSNFLDAFRFLRDIAKIGGGLQEAVNVRGGVSKIRSLFARTQSDIEMEVYLADESTKENLWKYAVGFSQTGGGVFNTRAKLKYEKVWDAKNNLILNRPNNKDTKDEKLLEFTHLEQPTTNAKFREIADFFQAIQYLHLVPQLVRDVKSFSWNTSKEDYYGRNFIERINKTNKKTRDAFLNKIKKALQAAVPQFNELDLVKDIEGIPHLQAIYKHWKPNGAKQWEDQFSDGTLRFIGLLWSLLDGNKPILLEEPELSLHSGVVSKLADIIANLQRKKIGKRQVIISTHSFDMLLNKGIGGEETLMLIPTNEGTAIKAASDNQEIKTLLESGLSIADVVLPHTTPQTIDQLTLPFIN